MPFTPEINPGLISGRRYKVVYMIPGVQRYARASVMDFLARQKRQDMDDLFIFSARPEAGTQEIDADWIQRIETVPPNTPISLNGRA